MLTERDVEKLKTARGLRLRIDMMCKSCIYDPSNVGAWRQQVTDCTCTDCPLWEVRPQTKGGKSG